MTNLTTTEEVDAALVDIKSRWPQWKYMKAEYDRLLDIVGSVEDDDVIALVILAATNSGTMVSTTKPPRSM